MKNKTANLDLFHDIGPAGPKPDRNQEKESKPEINKQVTENVSAEKNLKQKQEKKVPTGKNQHTPVAISAEKDVDQDQNWKPEQDQDWDQDADQEQEQKTKPVKNVYPPMNTLFSQAIAMMLPVWVYFCPGFPFSMPVMVLRPIIINPPVYPQN